MIGVGMGRAGQHPADHHAHDGFERIGDILDFQTEHGEPVGQLVGRPGIGRELAKPGKG